MPATLTGYFQLGQKITFNNATVFEYDLWISPTRVQLAVFSDDYLNDRLSAVLGGAEEPRADVYDAGLGGCGINVIKTNSARRETNEATSCIGIRSRSTGGTRS